MKKDIKHLILHPLYFLIRRRVILSIFIAILIPVLIHGARHAWVRTENRVEDWIPASFEETKLLMRFIGVFGADELLMVTWPTCTLDSPELEEFRTRLLAEVPRGDETVTYYREVLSGSEIFEMLREAPINLGRQAAIDRMAGWLISPDGSTTCLIALISPDGLRYRKDAVNHVWNVAEEIPGIGPENIHVAGSTMDSVAIDDASRAGLVRINMLSYAVCIVISFLCLRNIQATLLVFSLAALNQQLCLSIIYYSGAPFDSILMLAVSLTFVLSISFGMYIVNYYRNAIDRLSPQLAINCALRDTLVPTFLATVTTVAGLFSFLCSEMIPIRKFGFYSGVSVAASSALVLVFIGMHYSWFPARARRRNASNDKKPDESSAPWIGRTLRRYAPSFVFRYERAIIIVAAFLFIFGALGVSKIQTYIGLHAMLPGDSKPVRDYAWIEEKIGPLIPVEIVLAVKGDGDRNMFRYLHCIDELTRTLRSEISDDRTVISVLNFLPTLPPERGGARQNIAKTVFRRALYNNRDGLASSGYYKEVDGVQYLRITVRNFASGMTDQGQFLTEVKNATEKFLKNTNRFEPGELSEYFVCGGVPLVYRAQSQLLLDLQKSFLTAFLMIMVILMIVNRSFIRGFLLVLPNILPCLIVFGILGWCGIRVEIGTMLTGSAAMGISVDGTIHFMASYRESLKRGASRLEAIAFTYQRCGTALIQTATVCAFGLLVYATSDFTPTVSFSFFMFFLLIVSCIADLVFLPAILLGPMGRFFDVDAELPSATVDAGEPKDVPIVSVLEKEGA